MSVLKEDKLLSQQRQGLVFYFLFYSCFIHAQNYLLFPLRLEKVGSRALQNCQVRVLLSLWFILSAWEHNMLKQKPLEYYHSNSISRKQSVLLLKLSLKTSVSLIPMAYHRVRPHMMHLVLIFESLQPHSKATDQTFSLVHLN